MQHDDKRQAVSVAYRRVRLYACFCLHSFWFAIAKMSDEIIKFVQLIENNECLYKNDIQDYSNKDVIERAWSGIAKQMNWSVTFCKEKWRNIRNGYVRSIKPWFSGSSSKIKKKYYLHDVMQFVLPYVKPVQNAVQTSNIILTNFDYGEDPVEKSEESYDMLADETTNISLDTSLAIEKKKQKGSESPDEVDQAILTYIQNKEKEIHDDSRKMFLLSLIPDLNSLTDTQFRQFKIKTMILVDELLREQGQQCMDHHTNS